MKTISEYITILNNTKNNMITKLNSHGLNVSQSDSIYSLSNKIGDIESGVRLNIFSQTEQPTTYDGIWINTSSTVNKLAQVDNFISKWNNTYMSSIPQFKYLFGCVEYNGKIYCIGGYNSGGTAVATTYIYDIITNKWSIGADMPTAKSEFGCAVYEGKIYCMGGYASGYFSTTYIYDIANNNWSTGANMISAKSTFKSVAYNGKVYCISGYNTNTNYIYDIINNSWSSGKVIPQTKYNFGCTIVNGKVYCIGGCIGGYAGGAIATNYIYDIVTNEWTTGTSMSINAYGLGCVASGGNIYCIGGYNSSALATTYVYNIAGNSWTSSDNMLASNYNFGCTTYNGKVYCIGGQSNATNAIYCIDNVNVSLYNSDTLIMQHIDGTNTYNTILTNSNSFIGGFKYYFTDVAINSINADIYYGDGSQWIKIKSKT